MREVILRHLSDQDEERRTEIFSEVARDKSMASRQRLSRSD
jgi:hypothetical protein